MWSESPTGTPKRSRSVSIARRFISSGGAGYALTQCRSATGGSPAARMAATASPTSASVDMPVETIIGCRLAAT